jgi:16S rRNA (cytidine1402-2'-O)-methyltransferase
VACEDTRISAGLLRHLGMDKPLIALHQHNETVDAGKVLQRLGQGQRVAYVSDAGTPAVSDPGAVLVAQAAQAGYRVLPIPGASSALAALSVAGDARAAGFVFLGFLPSKGAERAAALRSAIDSPRTQLLFEAPHRIEELASALAQATPQRRLTLCRELTKQFETVVSLPAGELAAWLAADANRLRGEFVLVLHAQTPAAATDEALLNAEAARMLRVLLRELPLKQAVGLAAELSGAPRNALYEAALRLKSGAG